MCSTYSTSTLLLHASSQTSTLLRLQVNIITRTKFMWICTFFCMLEISGFGCRISVIKKPSYPGYVSMQGEQHCSDPCSCTAFWTLSAHQNAAGAHISRHWRVTET